MADTTQCLWFGDEYLSCGCKEHATMVKDIEKGIVRSASAYMANGSVDTKLGNSARKEAQ